jgi:acyl carrier protein
MDTFVFLSTVRSEISEFFKIPSAQITPEARLIEDLKFDSEDMHQLTMALEEVLSMEIPSEDLFKLHTVGEVVDYLSNAANSQCVAHGA